MTWGKRTKTWHVRITVEGHHHNLGSFDDELNAAKAYDNAARRLGAVRAKLNFK